MKREANTPVQSEDEMQAAPEPLHPYSEVISCLRGRLRVLDRARAEARSRLTRMRDDVAVVEETIALLSARAAEHHRAIALLDGIESAEPGSGGGWQTHAESAE